MIFYLKLDHPRTYLIFICGFFYFLKISFASKAFPKFFLWRKKLSSECS